MHRGGHRPPSSRQMRRCARLGVGAGSRTEQVGRAVAPDHALGMAQGRRNCRLRRIKRRAGVSQAAHRTGSVVCAMLALVRLTGSRGRAARTDRSRMKRVGGGNAGRPRRSNGREYLHHQSNQDDRKKFPQPPAHQRAHLFRHGQLIMQRVSSRDQVPGDMALRTIAGFAKARYIQGAR
jgi:hypothetical protein